MICTSSFDSTVETNGILVRSCRFSGRMLKQREALAAQKLRGDELKRECCKEMEDQKLPSAAIIIGPSASREKMHKRQLLRHLAGRVGIHHWRDEARTGCSPPPGVTAAVVELQVSEYQCNHSIEAVWQFRASLGRAPHPVDLPIVLARQHVAPPVGLIRIPQSPISLRVNPSFLCDFFSPFL